MKELNEQFDSIEFELSGFQYITETANFVIIKLNSDTLKVPKQYIVESKSLLTAKEAALVLEIPVRTIISLLENEVHQLVNQSWMVQ